METCGLPMRFPDAVTVRRTMCPSSLRNRFALSASQSASARGRLMGCWSAPGSFPFSRPAQPLGVGDAIKPIVIGTAIAPVDRIKRLAPTGKGAKGGERAYEGRLEKDRSRLQSPHSAATPDEAFRRLSRRQFGGGHNFGLWPSPFH